MEVTEIFYFAIVPNKILFVSWSAGVFSAATIKSSDRSRGGGQA